MDMILIDLAVAAVLGVVAWRGLWVWVNYGPRLRWPTFRRPRPALTAPQAEVEHEGADEPWGEKLHGWNTAEHEPVLMTHADYVTAGGKHYAELPTGPIFPALEPPPAAEPAELDLVEYASGGAFQPVPVPYAVDGEAWETDPLTVAADPQADARIFDTLMADFGPINLDWQPSWASSYTQYLRVLQPTYALPAGDRDYTGSFPILMGAS
jgi:hypothetical protein